ncbi:MAG TPA: hypothetical protein VJH20_03170 [Candidatus Nanoarchaeia archaeon]|nr:hypothetical protein [Candidatus Nanoarchaeia archaeon]
MMVTTKPINKTNTAQKKSSSSSDSHTSLVRELIKSNVTLQDKMADLIKSNSELMRAQIKTSEDISSMVSLFKEAGQHMVAETEEEKLRPLLNRISELVEQNKTIMRGLILIQKYIKSSSSEPLSQRPLGPEEF